MTPHISFIKLNVTLDRFKAICLAHKVTDLLAYEPRRLVGHARGDLPGEYLIL